MFPSSLVLRRNIVPGPGKVVVDAVAGAAGVIVVGADMGAEADIKEVEANPAVGIVGIIVIAPQKNRNTQPSPSQNRTITGEGSLEYRNRSQVAAMTARLRKIFFGDADRKSFII